MELLDQWKPRLDDQRPGYLVATPFVIAGDGSIAQLRGYRDRTILAAMRALEATYFDRAPDEPILILLFESDGPYTRLSKKWFGSENVPHFGYYRHRDRVMVMNVGTGTSHFPCGTALDWRARAMSVCWEPISCDGLAGVRWV